MSFILKKTLRSGKNGGGGGDSSSSLSGSDSNHAGSGATRRRSSSSLKGFTEAELMELEEDEQILNLVKSMSNEERKSFTQNFMMMKNTNTTNTNEKLLRSSFNTGDDDCQPQIKAFQERRRNSSKCDGKNVISMMMPTDNSNKRRTSSTSSFTPNDLPDASGYEQLMGLM